ncbi:cyclic pyranopterin monophosphate synthase MoaC [Megamonas hypermegale]|uniref:cyclic pyranopterin monophosphate synthase MoaC n=1 Tax=Megamonas hypermegale TaxID=158847 RepID=UPI0026F35326|nr:cyclic pyranopterin monophosphate synthase MoaC [Megamonas hypermegale]
MNFTHFNHFNSEGNAVMVDVGDKEITTRIAVAEGSIKVNSEVFYAVKNNTAKKGDVLAVARIAGIMAAKKTSDIIPLCHPLFITKAAVDFTLNETDLTITATAQVKVNGKTGVEMEALHAVSAALLTIYDMCKALDRSMEIQNIHLLHKEGGKSGIYDRKA